MSAPAEIHAIAETCLDDAAERDADVSADRRETFGLRLDRYWADLRDALVMIHPDPVVSGPLLERLVRLSATSYAEPAADLHLLDQRRLLQPDWLQQPADARLRLLRRPVRRRPRRASREHLDYLERARGHLPAPDAAAAAARGRQRRRLRRAPTTARCAPTSARWTTCATWRPTLRGRGHQPGARPGAQPRRPRARLGGGGPGRRRALPRLLPRLRRPHRARRLRAHAARGVPRLRAGQLHLGRRPRRRGCGRRSTRGSGTSTGPTPTVLLRVRRDRAVPRQPRAWRCCGSTPSRSSGSGWAPPARTSPRCTRSPRRCGRWPGSPRRRWSSRPRRSWARATWCTTSAPGAHPARSATSPTTTA